jgi:hypothetical protein
MYLIVYVWSTKPVRSCDRSVNKLTGLCISQAWLPVNTLWIFLFIYTFRLALGSVANMDAFPDIEVSVHHSFLSFVINKKETQCFGSRFWFCYQGSVWDFLICCHDFMAWCCDKGINVSTIFALLTAFLLEQSCLYCHCST